jgi:hypothetical protein
MLRNGCGQRRWLACRRCLPAGEQQSRPGAAQNRAGVALRQRSPADGSAPPVAPVWRLVRIAEATAHSAGLGQRLRHGGAGRPGDDGCRALVFAGQRRSLFSGAAVSKSGWRTRMVIRCGGKDRRVPDSPARVVPHYWEGSTGDEERERRESASEKNGLLTKDGWLRTGTWQHATGWGSSGWWVG